MVTVSLQPYHKGLTLEAPRSPDKFRDAVDVFNLIKTDTYIDLGSFFIGIVGNTGVGITIPENWELPFGRPYGYSHEWDYSQWRDGVIRRPE